MNVIPRQSAVRPLSHRTVGPITDLARSASLAPVAFKNRKGRGSSYRYRRPYCGHSGGGRLRRNRLARLGGEAHGPVVHEGPPRLEPMRKITRMLRARKPLILNWFEARGQVSLGAVEALNNRLKAYLERPCGFQSYRAIKVMFYDKCGALPELELAHRFC